MSNENSRTIRLGIFVVAGTALLITALYLIGNKQNLFGSTLRLKASFYNVNGLMRGNNVRFSGIDVGTVESVKIENDSSVTVTLVLEKNVQRFIRKNALASVGTDGLMGNKLVNINTGKYGAGPVEDGDVLLTRSPIEMDEMVRTLHVTNENIRVITDNLKTITHKINSRNSLWNVLLDTQVAVNVKSSVTNLRHISANGLILSENLKEASVRLSTGKGVLGQLISDTTLPGRIHRSFQKLEVLTDTASLIATRISSATSNLATGKGSLGRLLNDTTLVYDLSRSVNKIEQGATGFNENMEALKHTWPLRSYFRKKSKLSSK